MNKRERWIIPLIDNLEYAARYASIYRDWEKGEIEFIEPPVEILCMIFDDSGLSDKLGKELVFFGEIERVLMEMSNLADSLDTDKDIKNLLSDSDWKKFFLLAGQAAVLIRKYYD